MTYNVPSEHTELLRDELMGRMVSAYRASSVHPSNACILAPEAEELLNCYLENDRRPNEEAVMNAATFFAQGNAMLFRGCSLVDILNRRIPLDLGHTVIGVPEMRAALALMEYSVRHPAEQLMQYRVFDVIVELSDQKGNVTVKDVARKFPETPRETVMENLRVLAFCGDIKLRNSGVIRLTNRRNPTP